MLAQKENGGGGDEDRNFGSYAGNTQSGSQHAGDRRGRLYAPRLSRRADLLPRLRQTEQHAQGRGRSFLRRCAAGEYAFFQTLLAAEQYRHAFAGGSFPSVFSLRRIAALAVQQEQLSCGNRLGRSFCRGFRRRQLQRHLWPDALSLYGAASDSASSPRQAARPAAANVWPFPQAIDSAHSALDCKARRAKL